MALSIGLYMHSHLLIPFLIALHSIMSRRNPVLQSLLDSSSSSDDNELILTTAYLLQHEQDRLNAPRYDVSVPGHQVLTVIDKAGMLDYTKTISQMLQPTAQLSFGAGM